MQPSPGFQVRVSVCPIKFQFSSLDFIYKALTFSFPQFFIWTGFGHQFFWIFLGGEEGKVHLYDRHAPWSIMFQSRRMAMQSKRPVRWKFEFPVESPPPPLPPLPYRKPLRPDWNPIKNFDTSDTGFRSCTIRRSTFLIQMRYFFGCYFFVSVLITKIKTNTASIKIMSYFLPNTPNQPLFQPGNFK